LIKYSNQTPKLEKDYQYRRLIMAKVEQKMVTTVELATRWNVSREHIWRQIQKGNIPSMRVGRRCLIPWDYVINYEKESY